MKSVMMREYHQPYSEIRKMSIREITFYMELNNAQVEYQKLNMKNLKK